MRQSKSALMRLLWIVRLERFVWLRLMCGRRWGHSVLLLLVLTLAVRLVLSLV